MAFEILWRELSPGYRLPEMTCPKRRSFFPAALPVLISLQHLQQPSKHVLVLVQSLVGVDADAVRMATDQLLHLAGASAAEGVEGPPGGWQGWAKAVNASSAGCGPPGAHATPGDDASGAELCRRSLTLPLAHGLASGVIPVASFPARRQHYAYLAF